MNSASTLPEGAADPHDEVSPGRQSISVRVYDRGSLEECEAAWWPEAERLFPQLAEHPERRFAWLRILDAGLKHKPFCLIATQNGRLTGILPLVLVASPLFGRRLVSLSYLNTGGVYAISEDVAGALIDRAGQLADELRVRTLELRHETPIAHRLLTRTVDSKVQMRLSLPGTSEALWKRFKPEVRNLVRNGEKRSLEILWGGVDRLDDFYAIFARNMHDLGTPVFSRRLFEAMLRELPDRAEICVCRQEGQAIAAALLIHGDGVTEVPSASSLREFRRTNCNMLMYWHLLQRAIERGQTVFDFGRSTIDSSTYNFKKQWGAVPSPTAWQYYVRQGDVGDVRPDNPKYRVFIALWRRLPHWVTRMIGPGIVRGIP